MNPETNARVGPDEHPPNACRADTAKEMSARIAESATGLSLFVTAILVTAAFILLFTLGNRDSPYYAASWLAILAGLGLIHWPLFFWIQKRRTLAGLPIVEAKRPGPARIVMLAAALSLCMAGAYLVMLYLNAFDKYRFILIVPFGVAFGLAWGAYGLKGRHWEDVIQGLALCAISTIAGLDPRFPPEVWLILFAFCFVPSGLVKHIRWRRWVRSIQQREKEPATEGAQP